MKIYRSFTLSRKQLNNVIICGFRVLKIGNQLTRRELASLPSLEPSLALSALQGIEMYYYLYHSQCYPGTNPETQLFQQTMDQMRCIEQK